MEELCTRDFNLTVLLYSTVLTSKTPSMRFLFIVGSLKSQHKLVNFFSVFFFFEYAAVTSREQTFCCKPSMTSVVWDRSLLQVQVIPWVISDSNYVRCPAQRLDPSKTVFVGALHGMLNAEALASIMNDLFGGVMYAGIDTDKHKYPIGEEATP